MTFKPLSFQRYLTTAPLALAIERSWECAILSQQDFTGPVLDIGCGEGIFAWNLFDKKIETGIDPQAHEIARARDFNMYGELIECFGDRIPKEDRSYHTVFSNSVMEHIPAIEPVLREVHRLMRDDGVLYLTLPTDKFEEYTLISRTLALLGLNGLRLKYQAFFNRFWVHYNRHDRAGWEDIFSRNGFAVVESFEYASKGQCLFNDISSPFSILNFISKRTANRWFILPGLRKAAGAPLLNALFRPLSKLQKQAPGTGGLIFFKLRKK